MMPMFSFSFGEALSAAPALPVIKTPTPARAVFFKKQRRFVRFRIGTLLAYGRQT
jgi:hypothetical protein